MTVLTIPDRQRAERSREAYRLALQRNTADGRIPCQVDPDIDAWFAEPGSKRSVYAQDKCGPCPLWQQCQDYALDIGVPNGVWGGINEHQREIVWKAEGGRPVHWQNEMDAQTLAMLQERRDREAFDREDPYVTELEATA